MQHAEAKKLPPRVAFWRVRCLIDIETSAELGGGIYACNNLFYSTKIMR